MTEPTLQYLTVEVTTFCNLNCRMCFKRGLKEMPYRHLSLEMFLKSLNEANPRMGVTFVGLGEPLLNPDFYEMLKETRKRGLIINLVTNGLLMNEDWSKKLIELKTDKISISLDAATKETYDSIRRGSDFNKVMANIRVLMKMKDSLGTNKPGVRLDMVLMKSNIKELPTFVKLAIEL